MMTPEERRWDGSRDGTVLQGLLHTERWKPAPNLSVTKRAEPLPEPQLKHSWNNKACTHNDTVHKKNAGEAQQSERARGVCSWAFTVQKAALGNLYLS